jgi:hypothetical protein
MNESRVVKIDHVEAPNLLVDKKNASKPLTCHAKRPINCEQLPLYIETTNRFEMLHNLNVDGTQAVLPRNKNTYTKQQPLGNKLLKENGIVYYNHI